MHEDCIAKGILDYKINVHCECITLLVPHVIHHSSGSLTASPSSFLNGI